MNITKVPCLAYITGSIDGLNDMRIVTVLRKYTGEPLDGGYVWKFPFDGMWVIESTGSPLVLHFHNCATQKLVHTRAIDDRCLREIKGDDKTIETEVTEPIVEEA